MSHIEVTPEYLRDAAGRLRSTHVVARRARTALAGAGPGITGSVALSAALSEHSDAWEWCLQRLHDRLVSGSRALADAALAYEAFERSVIPTTNDAGQGGPGRRRVEGSPARAVHNQAGSGHGRVVRP